MHTFSLLILLFKKSVFYPKCDLFIPILQKRVNFLHHNSGIGTVLKVNDPTFQTALLFNENLCFIDEFMYFEVFLMGYKSCRSTRKPIRMSICFFRNTENMPEKIPYSPVEPLLQIQLHSSAPGIKSLLFSAYQS